MGSMDFRTEQRQQQTLSPRLQHAVRLLQLSSLEFAQQVHDALGKNPFLEEDTDGEETPEQVAAAEEAQAAQEAIAADRRQRALDDNLTRMQRDAVTPPIMPPVINPPNGRIIADDGTAILVGEVSYGLPESVFVGTPSGSRISSAAGSPFGRLLPSQMRTICAPLEAILEIAGL